MYSSHPFSVPNPHSLSSLNRRHYFYIHLYYKPDDRKTNIAALANIVTKCVVHEPMFTVYIKAILACRRRVP